MAHLKPMVLVLWHEHFDEIATAIFVGELRAVGQNVRLVGLGASKNRGKHGLRLVPDMTMSEALALIDDVGMVVLPCEVWSEPVATYDPRLRDLLFPLSNRQARLMASITAIAALTEWLPPGAEPSLHGYPANEALVSFVRGIALSL